MRIYLSGPTTPDWRDEVGERLKALGHKIVGPKAVACGPKDATITEIVEEDKRCIDACDLLLVNFQRPSPRVAMEVLYAWERGKTVVVVHGDSHVFPWLEYHSHKLVRDFDEALELLKGSSLRQD